MQIPNPYIWKHYKKLIIVPIVLLLASTFFIFFKGIPAGVDLKGGLLITVQTDENVNLQLLKQKLTPFSDEVEARFYEGPAGKGVEIELGINENIEKADALVRELKEKDTELLREEQNIQAYKNSKERDAAEELAKAEKRAAELRKEILEKARLALEYIGSKKSLGSEPHDAVKTADEELGNAREESRDKIMEAIGSVIKVKDYSFKEVGSSLSKFFFAKTYEVIFYAFVLSAIIIFFVIRNIIASVAVISGAFSDIWITLGLMSILNIPLNLASVAAILMLIGFSLETDCMLTIRVMKRTEDTPEIRAYEAMKTGFLMNLCAIGSFGVLVLVSMWLQIPTYYQIGTVAVMGSIVDFIATWLANAIMVLWYVERQQKKRMR
ncbi:hypothetical protein HY991_05350 [Candidatus Micrarchaeota archaeon]|nr:hypothetical protein [Candidatus Micrarchaeota archaeon]